MLVKKVGNLYMAELLYFTSQLSAYVCNWIVL